MPRIELLLPGVLKTQVEPFSDVYRVTVEREDGIACSEMEARTALSMLCFHAKDEGTKEGPKGQPGASMKPNRGDVRMVPMSPEIHQRAVKRAGLAVDRMRRAPKGRAGEAERQKASFWFAAWMTRTGISNTE